MAGYRFSPLFIVNSFVFYIQKKNNEINSQGSSIFVNFIFFYLHRDTDDFISNVMFQSCDRSINAVLLKIIARGVKKSMQRVMIQCECRGREGEEGNIAHSSLPIYCYSISTYRLFCTDVSFLYYIYGGAMGAVDRKNTGLKRSFMRSALKFHNITGINFLSGVK